ncbi:MAG: NAD(+)/NADH kinase [Verrucomicrobiae bacterium]|nr:NAD(+)/NADH kinase [Verrucomicrobiae bacterium]
MKPIGIYGNLEKPKVASVARALMARLQRLRQKFLVEEKLADLLGHRDGHSVAALGRVCRMLIVLGGDGTVLRAARALHPREIPLLAVNLGKLGFLAAVTPSELHDVLPEILAGRGRLTAHSMLRVSVESANRRLRGLVALNDAVVSRGIGSRLIEMELRVNGEFLNSYFCDGMILATATGSTAYSLSAGGPILVPWARAMAITPICPHTISNRSMVLVERAVIELRVLRCPGELFLSLDGQDTYRLSAEDRVSARLGRFCVRMLRPAGRDFFALLRKKLHWAGSNI